MIWGDFLGCSCCDLLQKAALHSLHVHKHGCDRQRLRVLHTIQDCCLIQNHNGRDEDRPLLTSGYFFVVILVAGLLKTTYRCSSMDHATLLENDRVEMSRLDTLAESIGIDIQLVVVKQLSTNCSETSHVIQVNLYAMLSRFYFIVGSM